MIRRHPGQEMATWSNSLLGTPPAEGQALGVESPLPGLVPFFQGCIVGIHSWWVGLEQGPLLKPFLIDEMY
jgi:hypothetical protein